MKSKYFYSLFILPLCLVSCNAKHKAAEAKTSAQTQQSVYNNEILLSAKQMHTVNIEIGHIEHRKLNSLLQVNGQIALAPQMKADVNSLISGIIEEIFVAEGQHIAKGQIVAYLENTRIVEIQEQYLIAQKEFLKAQQDYQRQKELFQENAGVQKDFQQATVAFEIAKAQISGLKKQMEQLHIDPRKVSDGTIVSRIPIIAPISGTINKINVNTGSFINPADRLMSINDNTQLHCDLLVFEKDIDFVKRGQPVSITLTNRPEIKLTGKVFGINKSFEKDIQAVIVHVDIDRSRNAQLFAGMYVTAHINIGQQNSLALPKQSIVTVNGKKLIYILARKKIVKNDTIYHFMAHEINTGLAEADYMQIYPDSTLLSGNTIIARTGTFYIAAAANHDESDED